MGESGGFGRDFGRKARMKDAGFDVAGHLAMGVAAEGNFVTDSRSEFVDARSFQTIFGAVLDGEEFISRNDLDGVPRSIRVGSDVV